MLSGYGQAAWSRLAPRTGHIHLAYHGQDRDFASPPHHSARGFPQQEASRREAPRIDLCHHDEESPEFNPWWVLLAPSIA